MADDADPRARATAALAEMFSEMAYRAADLHGLESESIDLGHGCTAEALGLALEALDADLFSRRPRSLKAHDVRRRTLATEMGDASLSTRRYRDRFGSDARLLADALDIPYGSRISPGATEFPIQAAALVPCAKAARLLSRHGSAVEPASVTGRMREAGMLCAEADRPAAEALYERGVAPEADHAAAGLRMEADGAWFRLQGRPKGAPERAEAKAVCAYEGREMKGGKARRKGAVHHARIATGDEVRSEAVPIIGGSSASPSSRAFASGRTASRGARPLRGSSPRPRPPSTSTLST